MDEHDESSDVEMIPIEEKQRPVDNARTALKIGSQSQVTKTINSLVDVTDLTLLKFIE